MVTRNQDKASRYLDYLKKEISMIARHLDADRKVMQLHFGGGTPTFYSIGQLRDLLGHISKHFLLVFDPDRDYSIEIDPRTVDKIYIQGLAALGFNRISIGIQDFDSQVQEAIHRTQDENHIADLISQAQQSAIESINVDLVYGLPKQSVATFRETLRKTIDMQPDRITIFHYAHMPAMFPAQKRILDSDIPDKETQLDMHIEANEMLARSGYVSIGMDHFARQGDPLTKAFEQGSLHRNFQGYTTHSHCELVGMGVSAIGDIDRFLYQNAKSLDDYYEAIDQSTLPMVKGLKRSEDDDIREQVIMNLMCTGKIDKNVFRELNDYDFDHYFKAELKRMQQVELDNLLTVDVSSLEVSSLGRLMIRNIAMIFDRYRQ